MVQNPQKNPDFHQNAVTPVLGHYAPARTIPSNPVHQWRSTHLLPLQVNLKMMTIVSKLQTLSPKYIYKQVIEHHLYTDHAAVFIGCIAGSARSSVSLSLLHGLLTQRMKWKWSEKPGSFRTSLSARV